MIFYFGWMLIATSVFSSDVLDHTLSVPHKIQSGSTNACDYADRFVSPIYAYSVICPLLLERPSDPSY